MEDDDVRERLAAVRDRVRRACEAAGRAPDAVTLLLASKAQPLAAVRAALEADADLRAAGLRAAGLRAAGPVPAPVLLGENRVQELVAKAPLLADLDPAWHFIGPLQSNKVNAVLRFARCVQTVAAPELADRLAARAAGLPAPLDVMVQVNVSGEPTKSGVAPSAARALALHVAALPGLRLTGFMTVGANSPDERVVAAGYDALRALRDEVVTGGAPGTAAADGLSMGMSRDLELAIAHGATVVRVGTAVFGSR
ncbi:YggS family pyridoxal phosphate-dependent enzyme [Cellulomonas sp. DKR-3]|uniref:Pyridoxal phosphate homeostasis protein n=1 Tax=Cellulomonas fulva TaxID=2835530 RepID=A0ABS5U218_9CELL|nr:YggS family pyridoxal phosphate-dependent enzyme [Cellulomonas fulva]MBT0995397.1 YggS family pyridoxal phosphate-dependent enzyme [Cellulomonas fulva]